MRRLMVALGVALALVVAGCSSDPAGSDRVQVVATTTIIGDVVGNTTGLDADVEVLMPAGASPHEFVPSAQQVAKIYAADLVVANGLGLEAALDDVLAAALGDGVRVLTLGPALDPLSLSDGSGVDPHIWMDPLRMIDAARLIADELTLVRPSVGWGDNADAYATELQEADETIVGMFGDLPPEQRKLVTNHDALGYFADRYGFEVIGTVIPGGSSLGDPSSAALAELVAVINDERVPAIFAETTEPKALAEAVAAEAGDVTVVELLTGSLADRGRPGDTLIGMLLVDAERIAGGLGS